MGVPKFFRWISERYPRVNQRYGRVPEADRIEEHFGSIPTSTFPEAPDDLSTCAVPPPIDRLYIDMNGIIHGCSHNNNDGDDDTEGVAQISEPEIFRNVCYYLDRVVSELTHPNALVYMAVDGVAPRAKLNQQRSRRYRSGKEGLIEQTIYEAHMKKQLDQEMVFTTPGSGDVQDLDADEKNPDFEEVEPGRFAGKVLAHWDQEADPGMHEDLFHSNNITPGTPFFERCTEAIEHFVQRKISEDPNWKHLTVIFSGSNVPGEGEHKIMQFMREQRTTYDAKVANGTEGDVDPINSMEYHPNLRHCIMGQDGDLIILGLALHEPNLVLLREQVLFDARRRAKAEDLAASIDGYLFNPNFEFLHMNVLRDYLAYEFETSNVIDMSPWDIEHCIDDFVLLSFLVGMDFLPGLPAIDIADEAYDLLFYTYRDQRKKWKKNQEFIPYLTDHGSIISGHRLENFLQAVGRHETTYFDFKRSTDDLESDRKMEAKYGMNTIPSDEVLADKESADRAAFRERISVQIEEEAIPEGFAPVVSAKPRHDDASAEALTERMGGLLQIGIGGKDLHVDENDTKGRYYSDKFGFSPFDAENHIALRKAYIEGLVWCLKYYYEGCVSWEWYFPYHYGPMLSDIIGVESMLKEISFEGRMAEPLRPFEQLLACMPPSFAEVLPEPYQGLMTESSSPIADFYPLTFTIDMNGKRWPWEAVVLLPFIESKRLLEASHSVDQSLLNEDERRRNEFGTAVVFQHDNKAKKTLGGVGEGPMFAILPDCKTITLPFEKTPLQYTKVDEKPLLKPKLLKGVEVPLPGFPTLRDGTVVGLWRKMIRVNVHGTKSRYKTACLEIENPVPDALFSLETLSSKLIGKLIWINYPHFIQAFVTAVSDNEAFIRGKGSILQPWSAEERKLRRKRVTKVTSQYVFGESKVGTGGIGLADGEEAMDALETLINVRPFVGTRELPDGTIGKVFAKFEIEVPLFVTCWAPQKSDYRLANLPILLEKDPYNKVDYVLTNPDTVKVPSPRNLLPSSSNHVSRIPMHARCFHTTRRGFTTTGYIDKALGGSMLRAPLCISSPPLHPLQRRAGVGKTMSRNWQLKSARLPNRRFSIVSLGVALLATFCSGVTSASSVPHERRSLQGINERDVALSGVSHVLQPPEFGKSGPLEFSHGTTTLSFTFQGGIVVAADSRASMGSFVGSKTTQKILPINTHVLGTMAGSAADLMFWIRIIRCEATQHNFAENRRMSVARASRLLANALYEYRGMELSIGTLISGFDDHGKGHVIEPVIYYVDNSGLRLKGDSFAVGSGSTLALGIIDEERRFDMTEGDAIALGIKAIKHATFRDAHSGGFINVYVIRPDKGWELVFAQDLDSLNRHPAL